MNIDIIDIFYIEYLSYLMLKVARMLVEAEEGATNRQ